MSAQQTAAKCTRIKETTADVRNQEDSFLQQKLKSVFVRMFPQAQNKPIKMIFFIFLTFLVSLTSFLPLPTTLSS